MKVKVYDGEFVEIYEEVVGHISAKHSEALSLLGLNEGLFFDFLRGVLEAPTEVYVDSSGSRYFLRKVEDFYLNVVVDEGVVRTAYLITSKTHSRMRRRKWLRRLC